MFRNLDEYEKQTDIDERMFDSFNSDIEADMETVENIILKMQKVADGYEDYNYKDEIKKRILDML